MILTEIKIMLEFRPMTETKTNANKIKITKWN
jgi:hypothetical protein